MPPQDDPKAALVWQPRLRILCLHGRCQSAASFAEFVFIDGPVELPLQHEERVNTRGWWDDADKSESSVRQVLESAWADQGPFDGVLGFSEGANAAVAFCRLAAVAASDAVG